LHCYDVKRIRTARGFRNSSMMPAPEDFTVEKNAELSKLAEEIFKQQR
jgi:hypothetical protein